MKRVFILCFILAIIAAFYTIPLHAQDSNPNWTLPPLDSITPENASAIEFIGSLGYGSFPRPTWSPDSQTVLFESSSGTWLYRVADIENPILLPEYDRVQGFMEDGTMFYARDKWGTWAAVDVNTFQKTSPVAPPPSAYEIVTPEPPPFGEWTITSPDNRYVVNELPVPEDAEKDEWQRRTIWQIVDSSTGQVATELEAANRFTPYTFWMAPFVPRFTDSGFLFRRENNLWRWNPSDGSEQLLIENMHDVEFSPDSRYVALFRINGDINMEAPIAIWDISGPEAIPLMQEIFAETNYWLSVAVHPTQPEIALGGSDNLLRFWSLANRGLTAIDVVPLRANSYSAIYALAYSPDGKWLMGCLEFHSTGSVCFLRDNATGLELATIEANIWAHAIAFHPIEPLIAIGYADGSIRFWEIETLLANPVDNDFTRPDRVFAGHGGPVTELVFSANGQQLISVSEDTTGRVWDYESAVSREATGHTKPIDAVALTGRFMATGSRDGTVRLWDVASPSMAFDALLISFPIDENSDPRTRSVNDVVFSPDGRLLAAAHVGDGIYIWDTVTRTQLLHLPYSQIRCLRCYRETFLEFDSTGTLLMIIFSAAGEVQLWGVPQQ